MKYFLLFDLAHFIMDEFTAHKSLIAFVVIGLAAGLIAQLIIPGKGHGLVATAVIGIAGAFLSQLFILEYIKFIDEGWLKNLVGAIVGAGIVQLAVALVTSNLPKKKEAK